VAFPIFSKFVFVGGKGTKFGSKARRSARKASAISQDHQVSLPVPAPYLKTTRSAYQFQRHISRPPVPAPYLKTTRSAYQFQRHISRPPVPLTSSSAISQDHQFRLPVPAPYLKTTRSAYQLTFLFLIAWNFLTR
jgi:hypothetical protein